MCKALEVSGYRFGIDVLGLRFGVVGMGPGLDCRNLKLHVKCWAYIRLVIADELPVQGT